ncbi:MAG: hypothetical protein U0229_07300 [Anaeromyxobacter sp.]
MAGLAAEFHDATLIGVRRNGGDVVLDATLFIHRSDGRPGWDVGEGWYQDAEIVLSEAAILQEPASLPISISDGAATVKGQRFANLLPLPCDLNGGVEIDLSGPEGVLRVTAATIRITLAGQPGPFEPFHRSRANPA